jgi:hypothetical protein
MARSKAGPDRVRVLTVSNVPHVIDWTSHCSFTVRGRLEQPVMAGG